MYTYICYISPQLVDSDAPPRKDHGRGGSSAEFAAPRDGALWGAYAAAGYPAGKSWVGWRISWENDL